MWLLANKIKNYRLFPSQTEKKLEHEGLSKLIFKKILLDHPKVLANFVILELNVDHVKAIEDMIGIDKKVHSAINDNDFRHYSIVEKNVTMSYKQEIPLWGTYK